MVGLLTSAVLATALVVISGLGSSGLSMFNTLILITGITSALPYFLTAMASMYLLLHVANDHTRQLSPVTSQSLWLPRSSRFGASWAQAFSR